MEIEKSASFNIESSFLHGWKAPAPMLLRDSTKNINNKKYLVLQNVYHNYSSFHSHVLSTYHTSNHTHTLSHFIYRVKSFPPSHIC